MSRFQGSGGGGSSSLIVTNPVVTNELLVDADTEYEVVLPDNTKRFKMRVRQGSAKLQISYVSGETNTTYWSIIPGNVYEETGISNESLTLYVRSNKDATMLEFIIWT
jgi:hypothetical protein